MIIVSPRHLVHNLPQCEQYEGKDVCWRPVWSYGWMCQSLYDRREQLSHNVQFPAAHKLAVSVEGDCRPDYTTCK